METTSQMLI